MKNLRPNRILAILAHPDDESFAIGGTLAKYAHQGIQVILLTATRGEAGIPGTKCEKAGGIREQELLRAARHLGIEVYFLDYQDGELSTANPENLLEHIASWIDSVHPQVILTFGPDGVSGHPDHVTVSHIVTQAGQSTSQRNKFQVHCSPFEQVAANFGYARTGHFNHHFSAAFEQISCLAFEMLLEKSKCPLSIAI